MAETTDKFEKVSVKSEAKREIDIIAAAERRHVYEVVADAIKLYMAVSYGKTTLIKKSKKVDPVTVADVVASH